MNTTENKKDEGPDLIDLEEKHNNIPNLQNLIVDNFTDQNKEANEEIENGSSSPIQDEVIDKSAFK